MATFENAISKKLSDRRYAEVDWLLAGAREAGMDFDKLDRDQLVRFQQIQHAMWNDWQNSSDYRTVRAAEAEARSKAKAAAEKAKQEKQAKKAAPADESETVAADDKAADDKAKQAVAKQPAKSQKAASKK